jgi:nucleoside-diphosphate-sugar epimerase
MKGYRECLNALKKITLKYLFFIFFPALFLNSTNLFINAKMKLLITGGSGFLGQSIIPALSNSFEVTTIGIEEENDFTIDLSKETPLLNRHFNVVIHAAGKAHLVPKNQKEVNEFFLINTNGTKNLCKELEKNPPDAFIFISTVAVYGIENGTNIDENYPLNGNTPYALSKIEAEKFLIQWCRQHNVKLSILRPSLIAGKKPPGNLGAMIQGIKTGKYFRIGAGEARKSVLMADDIARLVPKLIYKGGIYNICDNHHPSFAELELIISKQLRQKIPKSIPFWAAKIITKFGDLLGPNAPINSTKLKKITQSLTFANEKAKRELNWEPLDVLKNFKIK